MISDQQTPASQPNTRPIPPRPFFTRRPFLVTLLSFILLVVFLAGMAGTAFADLFFNYGVAYGTRLDQVQDVTAGQLGATPIGVNVLLDHETDPNSPDIDKTLDMVKAGGFGYIRQILPWEEVERTKGVYDWERFDILVDKARDRGLQVLFRLDRPPSFYRLQSMEGLTADEKNQKSGPPDDFNEYYRFAGLVAARYKGKVEYYQIMNEPNLESEWNGKPVQPERYAELLKGAYRSIKAADPAAKVLAAPLAPTNALSPNMNDLEFLDRMYKAGAGNYFDILSVQLYGLGYSPDFRFIQPDPQFEGKQFIDLKRINLNRPASIHQVMIENGDGTKPAWASEYGWVSVPSSWPDAQKQTNWGKSVTEQEQADYLVQGIERVRKEWPWVGVINVWFFRPDNTPGMEETEATRYFSIVNPDFSPRPAYTALQQYNTTRANIAYTGWHPAANDPALQPSGPNLKLTFQGERAELVLKAAPGAPSFNVKVTVDGKDTHSLNYTGSAARLTLAEGLPDMTHVAEISGLDVSLIDSFYISRDNHFAWLIVLGLVVCSLGALASGAVLFIGFGNGLARLTPVAARTAVAGGGYLRRNFWPARHKWAPWAMILALLIFYYAPPAPVAILGAALFFPLCFIRPDFAIGLALFTAPFYLHPRNLRPGGTLEFALSEVIIVELAAAVSARWLVGLAWRTLRQIQAGRRYAFSLSPAKGWAWVRPWVRRQGVFFLPLAGLFILATVSLLTPLPAHLKEAVREYRLVIIEPLALFLLALAILGKSGAPAVARLLDFLVAGGVVVALFGLGQELFPLQAASTSDLLTATDTGCAIKTEGVVRICSVYSHPDNLGLFLGRVIPIAACLPLFFNQSGWRIWRNPSWRVKLYALALLPLLATLFLSYSRGAWLGVAAAFLGMFVVIGSRRWLIAYGVAALVGVAALPFIKIERITSLFTGGGSSNTRLYIWQSAIDIIKDHPLTGIGLDQFLYVYNPQYVNPLAWTERFTSHPHNMVLDFWLRLGILGPLLLIWLLFTFFKTALSRNLLKPGASRTAIAGRKTLAGGAPGENDAASGTLNAAKPDNRQLLRRALALGLSGSMLDFLVHGMVDNSFFVIDLAIIFCLSCAMLEMLRREAVKDASTGPEGSKENAA